jgi:hypothetical protein
MKRYTNPLFSAMVLYLVVHATLLAAPPKISNAAVDPNNRRHIIVDFDNPAPDRAAVKDPGYWIIYQTTDKATERLYVKTVYADGLTGPEVHVDLLLDRRVDKKPPVKALRITLVDATDVVQVDPLSSDVQLGVGPGMAGSGFSAAKGKTDSDVYFSGSYTAVKDNDPVYDIDSFAGYMHSIQKGNSEYGKIGLYGQVRTKTSPVADPNSFLTYLVYQKVLADRWWGRGHVQAPIVNYRFFGAEFDRNARELNLITSPMLTIPFRPVTPPENLSGKVTTWPQINFLLGTEHVDVRKSRIAQIGKWHTRGVLGATFTLGYGPKKPGFDSWQLTSGWQLRLAAAPEIFYDDRFAPIDPSTGKKNLKKTPPMLGTQPRHNFDTKFTYNYAPWGGITFEHTYGSLPPSFVKTDQSFAFGLSFTLQQSSYGRYAILKP